MKIHFLTICTLALVCAPPVLAEPIVVRQADQIDLLNYTPPEIYHGQMVVRVRTTSQTQLDAVLEVTESVWSENIGIGPLDIQIKRSHLNNITALGIPHDVLIDDLQAHTSANWNQLVKIERQEQEMLDKSPSQRGTTVHDDNWFANYKQLNDITDYINNIVNLRPDMASTSVIGQSWEGRDLFAITISAPDTIENPLANRPVIFIFSTVHAREWIAPMTTTYYASKFIQDYDTNPRIHAILDSARIVIIPIGNPDGYTFSWTDQRYWRKTRRENANGSYGVDINRNWGYEWGGSGSSGSSGSDTYRGTDPFSEPETRTIRDFAKSFGDQLAAHMEYHSYSQLVMYPWGYSRNAEVPEPDPTYFDHISSEIVTNIESVHGKRYIAQQASDLYPHAGNSPDWFYGELDIPSMLIELRPANSDFNPDPINILPCAQENYAGIQHYIERVLEPVSFWHNNYPTYPSAYEFTLRLTAIDSRETIDPASVTLYARIGSDNPYKPTPMLRDGLADYTVHFPQLPCGDIIEYYFQVATTIENTYTFPPDGAQNPYTMQSEEPVTSTIDTLEIESGWIVGSDTDTATAGIWTRMDPQGTGIQPEDDHTPSGTICWVTDGFAGTDPDDRDVDGGFTTLTSPRFNALDIGGEPIVSFWFWFVTTQQFGSKSMSLGFSNDDGQTWFSYNFYLGNEPIWHEVEIYFANFIEPTDQMRVRFLAEDRGQDHTVEVAIDDFSVKFIGCPTSNPADLNNDGSLDFLDISAFLIAFHSQNPSADFNHDGLLNFFDISAFMIAFSKG